MVPAAQDKPQAIHHQVNEEKPKKSNVKKAPGGIVPPSIYEKANAHSKKQAEKKLKKIKEKNKHQTVHEVSHTESKIHAKEQEIKNIDELVKKEAERIGITRPGTPQVPKHSLTHLEADSIHPF